MNGSTCGTPLEYLDDNSQISRMQTIQDMTYNAMQNSQAERNNNMNNTIQQAQHDPYYNVPNNYGYPQTGAGCTQCEMDPTQPLNTFNQRQTLPINDLVEDINTNMPHERMMVAEHMEAPYQMSWMDWLLVEFKEAAIVFVLFVVLAMPRVQEGICNLLRGVFPTCGEPNTTTIVIFATIMAGVYWAIRKYLVY